MTKIPSEEDFARADKLMEELDRNMDLVNFALQDYFKEICPDKFYDSHVLAEDYSQFRAYIFYKTTEDVVECEKSGISAKLRDFVYAELERQGRGDRASIEVSFEFDSDENVVAHFEGDYYLRLR